MCDVRYIYYHPSSSTFIGEFFRKSFLLPFFVPNGLASERRFYCQPSHVQTVSSRNSIAFRAAHKHDCTREVSPGDPFGFFHLFISDKSLACDNFVSRKVFRPARVRARNFRFSSARSLAIASVRFSSGHHLSLIP